MSAAHPLGFTRFLAGVAALAGLGLALASHAAGGSSVAVPPPESGASVEVFFSPGADTDKAIAGAIGTARKRVWIAGYFFTSSVVAKALAEAHRRQVDVRVLLDRSQVTNRYSSASYFHNQDVPLWINARYPLMHHKFVVIDAATVGLGSMNFTRAGSQQNAENFNFFRRWPQLTTTYAREFERLEKESERYRPGMRFDGDAGRSEKAE